MNNYNEQYYIMLSEGGANRVYLTPLQKTADRDFGDVYLPMGEPLFFENAYKEEEIKKNNYILTNVLMYSPFPVVDNAIRDKLKHFKISGMQFYPAVFIDDEGKYHENYWCTNFWERLDCWCRERSIIDEEDVSEKRKKSKWYSPEIDRFYLDEKVLDNIPEEERLIFRMDGGDADVFVHQCIVDIFMSENARGVKFYKVSEYETGMEYKTKR